MARRVLVTAGASGIGKEIARAFAEAGAKVCVRDINAAALDTAAKDIWGLKTDVCDASNRDDIERMAAASVDALGGLDVLVATSASQDRRLPSRMPTDQWEAVMTADVIGTSMSRAIAFLI